MSEITREIIQNIKHYDMDHGIAVLKIDIVDQDGNILRRKGEQGNITCFIPNDDKYAVVFEWKIGPNNWFTFDDKETFEKYFDYELKEGFGE